MRRICEPWEAFLTAASLFLSAAAAAVASGWPLLGSALALAAIMAGWGAVRKVSDD